MQHYYISYICCVVIVFNGYMLMPMHRAKIFHILHILETSRTQRIAQAQDRAIALVRDQKTVTKKELDCLFNILLFNNRSNVRRFVAIANRANIIDLALNELRDITGILPLLKNLLTTSARAHDNETGWYQLAVACYLYCSTSCTIKALNALQDHDANSLYGIITNNEWISCKTTPWGKALYEHGQRKRTIQDTLLHEKELASQCKDLTYTIYAKYEPSPYWASWTTRRTLT